MNRRTFLRTAGTSSLVGVTGLAGCSADEGDGSGDEPKAIPPPTADTPQESWGGVYFQRHISEMEMAGMAETEWYGVGVMYTHPHPFWVVSENDVSHVAIQESDDLHFMVVLWDAETRRIPATASLSFEFYRDGEFLLERDAWPMLSQVMGFHFGDNVPLEGAGTYRVDLSIDPLATPRTGAFADRFDELATTSFEFELDPDAMGNFGDRTPDKAGERDAAMEPMEMDMVPTGQLPPVEDLPGEVVGQGTSHHAVLGVTALAEEPRFDAEGATYLAVSLRTPYNRYPLGNASLSAVLAREGEVLFEGGLTETFDPELAIHHGAVVDGLESGDKLTIPVDSRPIVSRHAGYERAFLDMNDVTITV